MYPSNGPAAYNKGTLTDAASIAWDTNAVQLANLVLAGTGRTLTLKNLVANGRYTLIIAQDATGSRTITTYTSDNYGAVKWAAGTPPTLSTAAHAIDVLDFTTDGTYVYGSVKGKAFA